MIRRLAELAALVAVGIAVPVATPQLYSAGVTPEACLDNVGVTVVVDFHELGGGANVRCAPGPVSSGLDALDKAGIVWESVRRFPGFVCRIAGLPGPDKEACINTPPVTAYWSYWVAQRGGQWCYSSRGPGGRVPPPGTVEGWSFVLGKTGADTPPPSVPPPAPIDGQPPTPLSASDCGQPAGPSPVATTAAPVAPPPAPATTAAPQATASPTPPPTAPAVASRGAAPTTATPVAAASTAVAVVAGSGTSSTTSSVSTAASTSTTVPAESVASSEGSLATSTILSGTVESEVVLGTVDLSDDRRGGGGFGAPTAIGLVAAAGLAGAGVWAARRRRAVP